MNETEIEKLLEKYHTEVTLSDNAKCIRDYAMEQSKSPNTQLIIAYTFNMAYAIAKNEDKE